MLGKLAVFLQSKLAVVAVGAALVTGGGTAVVAMATTPTQLPSVAAASQSSLTSSPTDATPVATASSSTESTTVSQANSTQAEITGTVVAVDPTTSSFTMTLKDGSTVTVVTTAQTVFHVDTGSLSGIAGGYTVELKGVTQPDGSVVASVIDAAQKPDAHASEGKDGTSTSAASGSGDKSTSSSDGASSGKDGASPTATPTSGDGSSAGGDD